MSRRNLWLFTRAARVRSRVSDFKFEHLSLGYVLRVVTESIHELPVLGWLGPVGFLSFIAELLELEALKIDLFEALHARVLHDTLKSALRNL